jgi:hypothetical protein
VAGTCDTKPVHDLAGFHEFAEGGRLVFRFEESDEDLEQEVHLD